MKYLILTEKKSVNKYFEKVIEENGFTDFISLPVNAFAYNEETVPSINKDEMDLSNKYIYNDKVYYIQDTLINESLLEIKKYISEYTIVNGMDNDASGDALFNYVIKLLPDNIAISKNRFIYNDLSDLKQSFIDFINKK